MQDNYKRFILDDIHYFVTQSLPLRNRIEAKKQDFPSGSSIIQAIDRMKSALSDVAAEEGDFCPPEMEAIHIRMVHSVQVMESMLWLSIHIGNGSITPEQAGPVDALLVDDLFRFSRYIESLLQYRHTRDTETSRNNQE